MYYLQDTQAPISAIELYNDLCRRIISTELLPGTRISENAISTEYGISRSVLRTAIARLQQINLVVVYPQRGTFVKQFDVDQIHNAIMIRSVLEENAVFDILNDKCASESLLKDLYEMLEQMEQACEHKDHMDPAVIRDLNPNFHLRITQEIFPAGALNMLYEIRVHITRWTNIEEAILGIELDIIKQNREIYESLRDGKLRKTLSKIREHFHTLGSTIANVKEIHPEYFQ